MASEAASLCRDATETFARAVASNALTDVDKGLLTVAALAQQVNITRWSELAAGAGLRESAARAFSTTTLRERASELARSGLVVERDGGYRCAPPMRTLVLRFAAKRPDFERFVRVVVDPRGPLYDHALVGVHMQAKGALESLARLEADDREGAEDLAIEVLAVPFDADWYFGLEPRLRSRLVELATRGAEARSAFFDGLHRFLAEDVRRLSEATPTTVSAFAGLAILREEVETVRDLAAAAFARPQEILLRAAIDMAEGRIADAAKLAERATELKQGDHFGALAFLQILALGSAGTAPERAARLAARGCARKAAPFLQTFRVIEAFLASDATSGARLPKFGSAKGDLLTILAIALATRGAPVDGLLWVRIIGDATSMVPQLEKAGVSWLADQYRHTASVLYEELPSNQRILVGAAPPVPLSVTRPSLLRARATRPQWEVALEKLEAIAPKNGGAAVAIPEAKVQIVWRAFPDSGYIEPHVQKRSGTKWSAGRKLAVKHLLGSTDTTAALPPEDRRVASWAREERHISGGYPVVNHYLDRAAWLTLVGHPRVLLETSDQRLQVVAGAAKVVAQSRGELVTVSAEPSDLKDGINLRRTGNTVAVYSLDPTARAVLAAIGPGLEVPADAKSRLLAVLEAVARFMPVESTEQTRADRVEPDSTPCFRLVPSGGGLSVALLVRPLGTGPLVEPGSGAPTLLGRSGGRSIQTERDLELEVRRARAAVDACAALSQGQDGAYSWFLDDPVSCLEVVSSLRALEPDVSVEWPHGTPLRVRSRVGPRAIRGRVTLRGGWLELDARLAVDDALSIEMAQILELLAKHPGRFIQLATGEYVELERDLRDLLDSIAAARSRAPSQEGRVALPPSAVVVLDQLSSAASELSLDGGASAMLARLTAAFALVARVPKAFQGELRDYQLEGYQWLARLAQAELGACLADDMGLGKTIQVIALLSHRAVGGPALVVAPTSVCEGWRREIASFAPALSVRSYLGPDRSGMLERLGKRDVVVTSYAILQQDAAQFQAIEWYTAVLDEAQLIKNPETQRAKAAFGLSSKARVAATGTPVENHAGDLFSIFQFLNPGMLGSWQSFSASLASSAKKRLLRPFILRRTKAQVLHDLPPITEIERTVLMSPGEAKLYDSIRSSALAKVRAATKNPQARIQVFAELTRLRRLCCHPRLVAPEAELTSSKLESFLQLAEDMVGNRHRALVFSQFTDVLALVRPLLEEKKIAYQYLDGSTPAKQRAAAVDAFQAGEGDIFLISLKAGGFGLNLTAADYVIHLDPWWNPAVEQQASDRAHRIGQTRPVTVYRLVTEGTIESRIVELHREKRELAEALLSETDRAAALTADDLRALLEA